MKVINNIMEKLRFVKILLMEFSRNGIIFSKDFNLKICGSTNAY